MTRFIDFCCECRLLAEQTGVPHAVIDHRGEYSIAEYPEPARTHMRNRPDSYIRYRYMPRTPDQTGFGL